MKDLKKIIENTNFKLWESFSKYKEAWAEEKLLKKDLKDVCFANKTYSANDSQIKRFKNDIKDIKNRIEELKKENKKIEESTDEHATLFDFMYQTQTTFDQEKEIILNDFYRETLDFLWNNCEIKQKAWNLLIQYKK